MKTDLVYVSLLKYYLIWLLIKNGLLTVQGIWGSIKYWLEPESKKKAS